MTTECNQATFEFHGLVQRKVKARFDGGKITSDAGVLLLREVEKRTGLLGGLADCFSDHRAPRLIEHTVRELLGQRIYGLCLGYEDLNDHDQLRTDPMLAVAVEKADPLGNQRRQAGDRVKALAGKCTLHRLELTGTQVDGQERYKKIAMDPDKIDRWMVDAFLAAHGSAPKEIVLDLDATDDPIHGHQEVQIRLLRQLLLSAALHLFGRASAMRPVTVLQCRRCERRRRGIEPHHRPNPSELAGGVDYHPGRLGLLPG